ncbi:hydrogenase expression/formation protein HypE [Candidatus Poribacteria bacterium]|nr:hydrogenase expression/formation protein HypE [Candidatus Poribacteria bacterium]
MKKYISLSHGSGGQASKELISDLFKKHFSNLILNRFEDAAILSFAQDRIAFTTDSYVITPIFFPGGDIGKLAICGTVNDLSVMGAVPLYISVSFILEEGFLISELEKIVKSIAAVAKQAKIKIVTGDTKVVENGKGEKIYINTAGLGYVMQGKQTSPLNIQEGDVVIINGSMGDHGMAVMNVRANLGLKGDLISDCAPLNFMLKTCFQKCDTIHAVRDITRGGLATILNEFADTSGKGMLIYEDQIPIKKSVQAACDILGLDPLYVANEGKVVIVASKKEANKIVKILSEFKSGAQSAIIGEVTKETRVRLRTNVGGIRPLLMLDGDILPRIC